MQINIIKKLPYKIIFSLGMHGKFRFLSDETYLNLMYYCVFGRKLNLNNPQTFNEKIQWLKLYNHNPLYTKLVDKYEVKSYVSSLIGEEHVIPTLGVWNSFDEIDFNTLPEKFVLKCTHDSGGLVICRDKSKLNYRVVKKKIEHSLKQNYYWIGREWPYKDVKPRIIAEQYMENINESSLIDYKFYCFNGIPKFLYVSQGLEDHRTARISFLTLEWKFAPYQRSDYCSFDEVPAMPVKFDGMIDVCKILSRKMQFLRVDLYEINGKIYFSELTFSPSSGFMPLKRKEHDIELGKMLDLV